MKNNERKEKEGNYVRKQFIRFLKQKGGEVELYEDVLLSVLLTLKAERDKRSTTPMTKKEKGKKAATRQQGRL